MNKRDLQLIAASPAVFRERLLVDCDGAPKTLTKVADDWQRADFEALDPAWMRIAGRGTTEPCQQRAWLERPRGHSKTNDIAVMVTWALFASKRTLSGVACAADKNQARLLRTAILRLMRLNDWLAKFVDVQNFRVKNLHTGSELDILSSDVGGSFGRTPDFVVLDEVVHWTDRELFDSMLSASAKRRDCVVVCITNAGFEDTWQAKVREAVRADSEWYFSRLDGPQATWITADRLEAQRRLLPEPAFRRLWMNKWSSGSGDALSGEAIDGAITRVSPMNGDEKGWTFVGGLDLAVSRDHSAFCVVAKHTGYTERVSQPQPKRGTTVDALVDLGIVASAEPASGAEYVRREATHRVRLAHIQDWRPPRGGKIDLTTVEAAVLAADRRFRLSAVAFDPHQAELMAQRLERQRVSMEPVPQTPGNLQSMGAELLQQFHSRTVDLFHDEDLITDLKALRVVEKSYGYRLCSPRSSRGHGDRATAFALALLAAKRFTAPTFGTLTRPLLHEDVGADHFPDESPDRTLYRAYSGETNPLDHVLSEICG